MFAILPQSVHLKHPASRLSVISSRDWERIPPRAFPMLRATCSLLGVYLNAAPGQVLLDSVNDRKDGFPSFLRGRKYAASSVRSYLNFRRILLKSAKEFGWDPSEAVPEAWHGVLAIAAERKCTDIVKDLARARTQPREITIEDVDQW
jgi:hypothetical protein